MRGKQWGIGLTIWVIVCLAVACAGGAVPAQETRPVVTTSDEVVELRLWQHRNPTFMAANEALIKRFEAEHPNVKIKLEAFEYDVLIQRLQTSLPVGEEGDIIEMFGSWVCSYASRLAELPANMISYAEAKEIFYQAPLDGYYCDGKLYGLPNEFNIENGAVLVNPTLFREAGLTYPPQWQTMQDLLSDAQKLTKHDGDTMMTSGFHFVSGDGLVFQFLAGILQRGGEYWKPDGSGLVFTSSQAKATLEDMKAWVTDYAVTDPFLFNGDSNWVGTAFFNNKVGIGFAGPWIVPNGRTTHPDFEFEYIPLPNYAGDKHLFATDAGWGKVVSSNSKHKEIAFEFVKFVTMNVDSAKHWNLGTGTIPALKVVATDSDLLHQNPALQANLPILAYGRYVGPLPDRDRFEYEIVQPHILAVLQGTEEVDMALGAMENEVNATFH